MLDGTYVWPPHYGCEPRYVSEYYQGVGLESDSEVDSPGGIVVRVMLAQCDIKKCCGFV
jgi:hypothetical protein